MVSLLCAAADLARELAHLIRRRSRSSRTRRAEDDDTEEFRIDNVNTTTAGASAIERRHRLKRPRLPLPSRLHTSNSASACVVSTPSPSMATSVGSRNNAGGRPPPAPSKATTSVVKDSKMPSISPKTSLASKASLQKSAIIPNGVEQQAKQSPSPVDGKSRAKDDARDKRVPPIIPTTDDHTHQIGRFSIIDERPKDPGSLESDFDDLDDSICSQTAASPPATGSREGSRSSTEPPASTCAYISLDTVPNDPVIAPSFSSGHIAMTAAAAAHHHQLTTASSRFKIVPVDSTFKRGRWTCWDYYDTTDVSNGGAKGSLMKVASHPNKLALLHRNDMIEYDNKGRVSQTCSRHGSGIHVDKSELLHHAMANAAGAHHDAKPITPAQKDHHVVTFALGASEPSTPEDHTPTILSPTNTQGHASGGSGSAAGSSTGSQTTPTKGVGGVTSSKAPATSPMAAGGASTSAQKTAQGSTSKMSTKMSASSPKPPPSIPINISVSPVTPDLRSPSHRSGHQTPLRLATTSGDNDHNQLTVNAGHDFFSTPLLDRSLNTSHAGERSLLENLLPGTIPPAGSPHNIGSADAWQQENTATQGAGGTPNMVAIDSKIEQAMDLVKTHLMFAVREEVEILRAKIVDLETTVLRLEGENTVLRDHIPADILSKLLTPPSSNQSTVSSASVTPKATPA